MGFHTFTAGEVLTGANVNTYLMNQAVIVCTSGTRPAGPVNGMLIYETDTGRHMSYNGSVWAVVMTAVTAFTPTFAGVTVGNGTVAGYYTRFAGNICWYQAELIYGSTSSGTCTSITLPFTISPPTHIGQWFRWSGNNNNIGGAAYGVGSANTVTFRFLTSTSNNLDQTLTLASTDHLFVTGTFYAV